MKTFNLYALVMLILSFNNTALANSNFIPMPGTEFSNHTHPPAFSTVEISWPKGGAAYPIDHSVWYQSDSQHQWGIEYLIQPFGLKEYSPSRDTVFISRGASSESNQAKHSETTHYLYSNDRKHVCIIHFLLHWERPASESSHSRIKASLLGCQEVFKPT